MTLSFTSKLCASSPRSIFIFSSVVGAKTRDVVQAKSYKIVVIHDRFFRNFNRSLAGQKGDTKASIIVEITCRRQSPKIQPEGSSLIISWFINQPYIYDRKLTFMSLQVEHSLSIFKPRTVHYAIDLPETK